MELGKNHRGRILIGEIFLGVKKYIGNLFYLGKELYLFSTQAKLAVCSKICPKKVDLSIIYTQVGS